ncbi:tetratricopeptide repeat protein [Paraburkholderia azotifigens]|uniref:ADP-heptose--LPS heptosyltransferase n=1 Tax=Paraburkholderia azotifigens TaxID=2057004 RepID=A0A5C6VR99_9BURK|nr:tetratricopeptide repeat protein [Paraburkholderia azotifigens]TXC87154.1 ADP-heptose--LPS heptosyltransferase [Paraburkholderia azotifigens]
MNTSNLTPADPLEPLRARTSLPNAVAADWLALGNTLLEHANGDRGQLREAIDALVRAYRLDANCDPRLLHNVAQTAFILRDWPLVESSTALLLARDAGDANALVWRAAAVQERNDFAEAQRLLHEAARAAPGNHIVLHKLALSIKEQGRFGEAEALLRRVLEMTPNNAHALFDLSELEVRAGRYAQGWLDYEARVAFAHDANAAKAALAAISPNWRGESLAGKALVVYGEQGNGDCLWAVRFLPMLAERAQREGGRVVFGYAGPMQHLFERMLPAGITIETSLGTKPDYHCGLMSLPLRLGVNEPSIWGRPYLSADPARIEAWRARVAAAATGGNRKVGIVWNGNPGHIRDGRRSVDADEFARILDVPGVTFFAISPGREQTVGQWRTQNLDVVDLTPQFEAGFDDVAALLVNLDALLTIDSGPAHLAGALGVPTWLMLDHVSAWFWGEETERTPWYQTVDLFRQPSVGAWAPVLDQVRVRLEALAA